MATRDSTSNCCDVSVIERSRIGVGAQTLVHVLRSACQQISGFITHGDIKIAVMLNPEAHSHEVVHNPDDRASVVA